VNYEKDSAAAPSLARCEDTGRHKASEDQKRGGTHAPEKDHQRSKSVLQTAIENRAASSPMTLKQIHERLVARSST
jgi:hypothetical protein